MDTSLVFQPDKSFTIMQLTDVHWVDGKGSDNWTRRLMWKLLEQESPDLVVITGDLVYGDDNLAQLEHALTPILNRGLPWAFVFGNHDNELGASKKALLQRAMQLPGCLMSPGPADIHGEGNYMLGLHSADGALHWALHFIDSGTYNKNPDIGQYDYIHRDQISWYVKNTEALLRQHPDHSALAFFHIPLPEYRQVWSFHPCVGQKLDELACPGQNSGLFSAMLEMGNMKGTFVGHDHVNDYCGTLHGVRLCYGRASGYNTYGRRGFKKGCRMIRLNEDNPGEFESWLRLSDGSIDRQTELHQPHGWRLGEQ